MIDISSLENAISEYAKALKNLHNTNMTDSFAVSLLPYAKVLSSLKDKIAYEDIFVRLRELSEEYCYNQDNLLQTVAKLKWLGFPYAGLESDLKERVASLSKSKAKLLANIPEIEYGNRKKYKFEGVELSESNLEFVMQVSDAFDDITASDLLQFSRWLNEKPYLSLDSSVGRRILEHCREIDENDITVIQSGDIFFRARVMEDSTREYTENEIREAPYSIAGKGRFNLHGTGYFYVAGDISTACEEIRKHNSNSNKKAQVGVFEIEQSLRIFDLRKMNNAFSEKCLKEVKNIKDFNVEYLFPSFFAQCLFHTGVVDGILYGTDDKRLLALFNSRKAIYKGPKFIDL